MTIAGTIEVKRKYESVHHNYQISLFWLSFRYAIFGIADMFTLVGLMEFFYKEAPTGMRSLSTSFSWLSLSVGYFLSSAFVELIGVVTRKASKSKTGWLDGIDMNKNHPELFYWFLAILSLLNVANYVFWAKCVAVPGFLLPEGALVPGDTLLTQPIPEHALTVNPIPKGVPKEGLPLLAL
ncbi:hypothetical protein SO802_026922 [Lithocarpus litseifolius]|uniref:Uncharacterized protein n=1 Tax=Lithocarpus litseifolius TaxID=425828 RepID=A0AAW2C3K0_9ROSI